MDLKAAMSQLYDGQGNLKLAPQLSSVGLAELPYQGDLHTGRQFSLGGLLYRFSQVICTPAGETAAACGSGITPSRGKAPRLISPGKRSTSASSRWQPACSRSPKWATGLRS